MNIRCKIGKERKKIGEVGGRRKRKNRRIWEIDCFFRFIGDIGELDVILFVYIYIYGINLI
jgi:hypothetical protein